MKKNIIVTVIIFTVFNIFAEVNNDLTSDNLVKSESEKFSKNEKIISKIELSHSIPISYTSGANMPGFSYGFVFNYYLPLRSEYGIFKQNNLNINFHNQTSLTMDKIGLSFSITTLPFLEFNTGFSTIFIWKFFGNDKTLKKGESLNDTDGEGTEGIGFNFDLGINLKFSFNYFFPKVKLGFLNKSLFNYIFFPGINFWELSQYKIMLKNGWIFSNDFMILWNEKIFMPYLIMNTTCLFEKLDIFFLSVGGGIQLNFEKPGLSFNANTIVYLLPEEVSKNVKITLMIKHTFVKIVWNKKEDLLN